jgi:predicted alpha/beta hydrolase
MAMTVLTLKAADGYRLGATVFGNSSKSAVLVMPATGVPQTYYAKFAAYLAEHGFKVLTFDYRGIGQSLSASIKDSPARMRDWALLDAPAALDFLEKETRQLMVIGHSFGGQALGLLPRHERIAAALIVGSQSGYWRNWPLLGQAWMWPVTHMVLPTIPRLLGYLPSSHFGFGEDLPAGVAIEWASWCRNPTYLVGALRAEDSYARFAAPIRAYAMSDDAFAPVAAVQALLDLYPASKSEIRRVHPRDVGAGRIGHFGFFRESFRDTLWREAAQWLEAR